MIIFDNIVKLIELQDCESVTGHQEEEAQNTSSPGLLGSGSNPLGKGLNTDVGPTGELQDCIILSSEPSYLGRGLQDCGNITGSRSGLLVKRSNMKDKDYSYQPEHIVQNALSPSPLDKEPSLLG